MSNIFQELQTKWFHIINLVYNHDYGAIAHVRLFKNDFVDYFLSRLNDLNEMSGFSQEDYDVIQELIWYCDDLVDQMEHMNKTSDKIENLIIHGRRDGD